MESSSNQSPIPCFQDDMESARRDQHHQFPKRQKKLDSESETKALIPKIHTEQTCSGKLASFEFLKQKEELKKKRKREELKTRNVYGNRRWTVSHKNPSICKNKLVVVSYNILGVENVLKHPELYRHVPLKYLDWDYRKKVICKEISNYHAGIICFQEVDRYEELDAILRRDGFEGIYKGRTGEYCDGCAIFWKHDLFTLLHEENIEFRRFGLRDNVAQLCVLEMNENQIHSGIPSDSRKTSRTRRIVVGNIHVLFNPKRGDIKLGQVRTLVEKAHQLSLAWGSVPVILSGDLNSLAKSAMYQYLSSSELDIRLHDRRNISGQAYYSCRSVQSVHYNRNGFWKTVLQPLQYDWTSEELISATGCEEVTCLGHKLNLSSAYAGIPGTFETRDECGEPLGTVDYIWHTEDLVPLKILETLPISDLREIEGLPSKEWGSDHLALACEFAFLDKIDTTGTTSVVEKC